MDNKIIRIMDIVNDSVVDGVGIRDTIFVNMCAHRCNGCFNPETWDYKNGKDVSFEEINNNLIEGNGLTLSGGDPMLQAERLKNFIIKYIKPLNKNIWVYSGYTYEEIMSDPIKKSLLEQCDVLVDGRFILEERSLDLKFKGSRNQRIINIQESLKQNKIIILNLDDDNNDNKYGRSDGLFI